MSDQRRFDQAVDDVLADRSPRQAAQDLDPEQQQMLRMAQLLRGSRGQDSSPTFVEGLHGKLFGEPRKVSRRTAVVSAISTLAAGLLAGIAGNRLIVRGGTIPHGPLVSSGKWVPIATYAAVPEGAVHPFTAGALQGFLMKNGGELRAVSRICTHMGCTLKFKSSELVCPCHGAEFELNGAFRYGPGRYSNGLPPLPKIDVRVNGGSVEVLTV